MEKINFTYKFINAALEMVGFNADEIKRFPSFSVECRVENNEYGTLISITKVVCEDNFLADDPTDFMGTLTKGPLTEEQCRKFGIAEHSFFAIFEGHVRSMLDARRHA